VLRQPYVLKRRNPKVRKLFYVFCECAVHLIINNYEKIRGNYKKTLV